MGVYGELTIPISFENQSTQVVTKNYAYVTDYDCDGVYEILGSVAKINQKVYRER